MPSRVTASQNSNWPAFLIHLGMMGVAAIGGAALVRNPVGALFGIGLYLFAAIALRLLLAPDHRRGIRLVRANRWAEALRAFEASHAYFQRHPWLDRYRTVFLLSVSRASFREMALLNAAFCHTQLGNGAQAKETYQRALAEFPDSGMARAALNMIEAIEKSMRPKIANTVETRPD
jgi:tetratricopeptide (TPR) repeat protein